MALNQSAINVKVINGAETTQFSQALVVTSTVTALYALSRVAMLTLTSSIQSTVASLALLRAKLFEVVQGSTTSVTKAVSKIIEDFEITSSVLLTTANKIVTLVVNSVTTSSITKNVNKLIETIQNTFLSISRTFSKTLSVETTILSNAGSLNGLSLNSSPINANEYSTVGVVTSASIWVNFFFYKTFTVTSSIVQTLSRIVVPLNTFLITVNVTPSITKFVDKFIESVLSTVSVTMLRSLTLLREIIATVTNNVTLIATRLYYRILSVVSSTTSTIIKSIQKPLTILVNCGIILSKYVSKFIILSVTSTVTMIRSAISFIRFPLNKLIYAASKIRKVFYI